MSDHDDTSMGSGFSTPVPELDDHTGRSPIAQRNSTRRGTFESINIGKPAAIADPNGGEGMFATITRDFEEAVSDGDPVADEIDRGKSRRGTVTTIDPRSLSPPNSIKAFADARRRERAISVSDTNCGQDEHDLQRTCSIVSRASRRRLVDEAKSIDGSDKGAEEDVCFPLHKDPKDVLVVDYEVLEEFIVEEILAKEEAEKQSQMRVFHDLRKKDDTATVIATAGGDVMQNSSASSLNEKAAKHTPKPASLQPHSEETRYEYFSSLEETTIHAPDFSDLVMPGETVCNLFPTQIKDDFNGVWWLNVMNPTEREVRAICKAFQIHPLTMEDITQKEAREKIELFQSYYFASFRSFTTVEEDDGPEYEPYNMYVVVFREGTISFCYTPNAHAFHVRQRITKLNDLLLLSSDWICYALIDHIVDSFAPIIDKIDHETDVIEDQVFIVRQDDMHQFLRRIGTVRRNVMGLMKLLGGKADVLRGFTKRCNSDWKVTPRMDIGLYLGDVQDHVVTMMNNLGQFEKMLARAHSNYLAQLSMDNIVQSNHANRVLSKITLLATILVPLNLVCGLFGMNTAVPFQQSTSLAPFFSILGGLVLFTLTALVIARKMRFF